MTGTLSEYFGRSCGLNLQAFLFGYTVAFTGTTLDAMLMDVDVECAYGDPCYSIASGRIAGIISATALLGALLSGPIADSFGRRATLMANCILWISGYALMWKAESVTMLIIARSIQGLALGTTGVVCPMYNAEISPIQYRGKLGCVFNIELATGILLANSLGTSLSQSDPIWWRKLALIGNLPAILSLAILTFVLPESPIFCELHGEFQKAACIHWQLHGVTRVKPLDSWMLPSIHGSDKSREILPTMCSRANRRGVVTAVGVTCCFVLTGNNVFLAFLSDILRSAGANSTYGTIAISISQVAAAIIMGAWVVDAHGRRPLLLFSCIGSAFSMFGMAFCTWNELGGGFMIMAITYIVSITYGLSTLSWVYAAEVVPSAVRGRGMASCSIFFWSLTYAQITYYYYYEAVMSEFGVFICYGILCLLSGVFIYTMAHETEGLSLLQIEEIFSREADLFGIYSRSDDYLPVDSAETVPLRTITSPSRWCCMRQMAAGRDENSEQFAGTEGAEGDRERAI